MNVGCLFATEPVSYPYYEEQSQVYFSEHVR